MGEKDCDVPRRLIEERMEASVNKVVWRGAHGPGGTVFCALKILRTTCKLLEVIWVPIGIEALYVLSTLGTLGRL